MKLTQIRIDNFGQLSDLTFNLPDQGLSVFYGANEAGKSTVVAFVKQIMFGFYSKRKAAFFENYQPLAEVGPMGGSLTFLDDHGGSYELERLRSKNGKPKVGILTVKFNGQIVPESQFFAQVKNIDADFYTSSFIFNQDMLGQVSSLDKTELLERIYYLGAADSNTLLEIRGGFEKQAGNLFKPTGKKPEVNFLLRQMAAGREEISNKETELDDYQHADAQEADTRKALAKQEKNVAELEKQAAKFEQLQAESASYQKLLELKKEYHAVAFDTQNYQAAQKLALESKNLQTQIARLETEISQIKQDVNLQEKQVQKLIQQKPQLLEWQTEAKSCRQQLEQIEAEQQRLLALDSDLAAAFDLTETQLAALKDAYQALPVKAAENAPTSSHGKLVAGLGVLALVAGLIAITKSGVIGAICLLAGLGLFIWGYQSRRQNEKIKQEQVAAAKQRASFRQKYQLDPDQLDLNYLFSQWNQYQAIKARQTTSQQQLAAVNQEVEQFAKQLTQVKGQTVVNNFTEILQALDELEQELTAAREKQSQRTTLQANLTAEKTALSETDLKLQAKLAQADVSDMSAYEKLQGQYLRQTEVKTQIKALENNLAKDLTSLEKLAQNPAAIASDLQALTGKITAERTKANDLRDQAASFKNEKLRLTNSDAVANAKQDLATVEAQFTRSSKEYLADLLVADWINQALNLASNERFPKMVTAANEYFQLLTAGRYDKIKVDKKITVVRCDQQELALEYLSRGTAEQLYFALKLAFVQQVADEINLPVLIDDSFVNFDDQRVGFIKKLVMQIAQNNQVLIFTAQHSLVEKLACEPLTFTKG